MDDTHFFFVRVWQHQHQFRAAVQSDDGGEPHLFTEPEQVGEFLRGIHAASGGTQPHEPGDGGRAQRAGPKSCEPSPRVGPGGRQPSPTSND